MRVTPATAADIDDVVDLWVDLATDQRRHGSHVRPEPSRSAVRESVGRQIVTGYAYVAREDDAIVGFVASAIEQGGYELDVTRGVISSIFVRPAFRGDGVGSVLLETAEDGLVEAGADVLALEAMATNESARRFYRAHGYEPHRVELEKSVDPEDERRADRRDDDPTDGPDGDPTNGRDGAPDPT